MSDTRVRRQGSSAGALLRFWRTHRNLSQLALATEAQVSPRHLCFIETGRAKASRDMIVLLADVLDLPLRERNELLLAAGFAPIYAESALEAPVLASVRSALHAMLRQQEPFPAVVMDRRWNVIETNGAAARFFGFLLGERPLPAVPNVLRLMFDPRWLRPHVANWLVVAETLVSRFRRETVGGIPDELAQQLLAEVLAYPETPRNLRGAASPPGVPIVPIRFVKSGLEFNYFSTVTTLGTPQDITAQELRIECFFPLDDATDRRARELSA